MTAPNTIETRYNTPQASGRKQTSESNGPDHGSDQADHEHKLDWVELARIGFVGLAAAAVWLRIWEPFPRFSIVGIAATLIGGYPIFKEAWENIVERKMTMELSMTIALVAAVAIGEFFTALVITAFVLAAEVLEGLTVGRGRRAIRDLLDFLPRAISVRRDGQIVEIPAAQVEIGESVVVKPGGHIPVDGIVLSGRSFVEQAAITGEAMPVEKVSGDVVYAGTINQSWHPGDRRAETGPRHQLRTDRRSRRASGKIAGSDSENCRSSRRLPCLFRAWGSHPNLSYHSQHEIDDFGSNRRWCLRNCRRNSAGHSRSNRSCGASRRNRQRRPLSRSSRCD